MAVEIEWLESVKKSLKSMDHDFIQSKSISLVPEVLQKWNEDAYMPRVVSIGPRFKGSRDGLQIMEEGKLNCMLSLIHRAGRVGEANIYLQACGKVIDKLDSLVRASYLADINVGKSELAKIMLVDGCFLLELLISKGLDSQLCSRLTPKGPAAEMLKDEVILSDLMLLENQIPIIVLHRLFGALFPDLYSPHEMRNIINRLALSVFGYSCLDTLHFKQAPPHILDIVHLFVNGKGVDTPYDVVVDIIDSDSDSDSASASASALDSTQPETQLPKLKRCALRLLTAGVTIKPKLPNDEDKDSTGSVGLSFVCYCFLGMLFRLWNIFLMKRKHLDHSLEIKGLDFYFMFKNGKLEIEQLHITKTTRAKWCNIIAWEHRRSIKTRSHSGNHGNCGKFTWAALVFNGLICSEDDVQLLKDRKIVVDHLKMSNQELMEFFRKIASGVDYGVVDSNSYIQMVNDMNNFSVAFFIKRICSTVWNSFTYRQEWVVRFMNQNYNFVATVLSLLTVVQTVFAILAYYYRN